MVKKRKYRFVYANNSEEEELRLRKEFTETLLETIFKKWQSIDILIYSIALISINFVLYHNKIISLPVTIIIAIAIAIIGFIIHKKSKWKK